ncbi:MAG TPA: hypothetical protein PLH94_01455 [Fimbriimonadaceae bacterium]|nr:hypothetical protein [Fimbriimonadaceae bacterium]
MRKLAILLAMAFMASIVITGCGDKAEPPPEGKAGGSAKTPPGVETGGGTEGGKAQVPQ